MAPALQGHGSLPPRPPPMHSGQRVPVAPAWRDAAVWGGCWKASLRLDGRADLLAGADPGWAASFWSGSGSTAGKVGFLGTLAEGALVMRDTCRRRPTC